MRSCSRRASSLPIWPSRSWRLTLFGRLAPVVADLDPRLLHALVDDLDQVLATLFGEWRDVEANDGAVHVGHQPDVRLLDRLLDRAEDAAVPRLDDDLVRLRDADAGQLVERRLRAVVLAPGAAPPARSRRGPVRTVWKSRCIASMARDIRLSRLGRLGSVMCAPRLRECAFRPARPCAARRMLSGRFMLNTTIGRSFSMHSDTAVESRTPRRSWSTCE